MLLLLLLLQPQLLLTAAVAVQELGFGNKMFPKEGDPRLRPMPCQLHCVLWEAVAFIGHFCDLYELFQILWCARSSLLVCHKLGQDQFSKLG